MCMKTPKPKKVEEKPVQYLRNPWLDNFAISGGQGRGRSSLKIDPGTAGAAYVNPYVKAPTVAAPLGAVDAGLGAGTVTPTVPRVPRQLLRAVSPITR